MRKDQINYLPMNAGETSNGLFSTNGLFAIAQRAPTGMLIYSVGQGFSSGTASDFVDPWPVQFGRPLHRPPPVLLIFCKQGLMLLLCQLSNACLSEIPAWHIVRHATKV